VGMDCTRKPLAGYLLRRPGAAALAWVHGCRAVVAGANAAVFSLINILMFPMLPVREAQQLVEFLILYPGNSPLNVFSWQSYAITSFPDVSMCATRASNRKPWITCHRRISRLTCLSTPGIIRAKLRSYS
jgi:hypothetical protein